MGITSQFKNLLKHQQVNEENQLQRFENDKQKIHKLVKLQSKLPTLDTFKKVK
eukprot:403340812